MPTFRSRGARATFRGVRVVVRNAGYELGGFLDHWISDAPAAQDTGHSVFAVTLLASVLSNAGPPAQPAEAADNCLACWSSTSGTHEMSWRVAVDAAPVAKPQLVIGQVHDSKDDVVQVLYDGNDHAINYRWLGQTAGHLVSDYELGTYVDLKIVVKDGTFYLYANGELKATQSRSTSGLYFKAGNYSQSNPSKGDDPDLVTQVRISQLSVSHGG